MRHVNHRLWGARLGTLALVVGAISSVVTPQSVSAFTSDISITANVCNPAGKVGSLLLNTPIDGSSVDTANITLSGTASWLRHIHISRGGTPLAASALGYVASEPVTLTIPLVYGSNVLTLATTGGCPEATNSQQLTITNTSPSTTDTVAPQGTLAITHSSSRSPQLSGAIDDLQATIVVTINGRDYPAINKGDGTWMLAAGTISPELASGSYHVVVRFTDPTGNSSTVTSTLHIDADDELGFILAPNTGYIRIGSTNISSWSLYAFAIAVLILFVTLRRQTERQIMSPNPKT